MQLVKRLNAVHSGHSVIEEDNIKFLLSEFANAVFTARCGLDDHLRALEKSGQYLKVHRHIIHYKYPSAGSGEILSLSVSLPGLPFPVGRPELTYLFGITYFLPDAEIKP